jgi:hypothetical protein
LPQDALSSVKHNMEYSEITMHDIEISAFGEYTAEIFSKTFQLSGDCVGLQ